MFSGFVLKRTSPFIVLGVSVLFYFFYQLDIID